MYCDNCGAEIDRGQAFCAQCGTPVGVSQATQFAPMPNPSPTPPKQNNAVSGLVIACTVLVMLLIGLGLVAGGVIQINGSSNTQVEKVASNQSMKSSNSTSQSEPETIVIKETPGTEEDTSGTSSSSGSTNAGKSAQQPVTVEPEPEPSPSTSTSTETRSSGSNGFVFPDSSSRYLSESELYGIDNYTLYFARNEIYARHGRGFVREDLQSYFNTCSWYTRRIEPEDFVDEEHFNEYEMANVITIRNVEQAQGSPYL